MTIHVFYHSADFDGICSGAIIYRYLRSLAISEPDIAMRPINYGRPFPWDAIKHDDYVIMADFSLQPYSDMARLARICHLTWIDHHASAIENVDKNTMGLRDTRFAGCELAWQYYRHDKIPRAVHLMGRYDVWDNENEPDAMPFQYGLRMYSEAQDPKHEIWDRLFLGEVDAILEKGRAILEYVREENRKYCSTMFELHWQGLRWLVANRLMCNSSLFESRFNPEIHDAMMAFGFLRDKWKFSLYTTKPELDMSEIAARMGGGGHRKASGFLLDHIPFFIPEGNDHA